MPMPDYGITRRPLAPMPTAQPATGGSRFSGGAVSPFLNPRVGGLDQYGTGVGGVSGGGGAIRRMQTQQQAGGGAGGYGGGAPTGGGSVSVPELTLKSERSPDLDQAAQQYQQQMNTLQQRANQQDQNLEWQINQYKSRLGEGPTTRAIERSASAVRDMMAGQMEDAATQGARQGRGQGFGASGLAESGQRAQAGAAANIALGREGQLDALTLGGQQIMAAPGQRQMGYDQMASNFYGQNPAQLQANYGLGSQRLGLDAYMGQGNLAIQQAANQRQQYGSPMDWFSMLYGGL
jgi:hypothetical protein